MEEIKQLEAKYNIKVLCLYYCGSKAYGTEGAESDRDVMAIVDDDKPLRHIPFKEGESEKTEYFVIGKGYFKKVQSFDEDANNFVVAHADNILGLAKKENLIYLASSYKKEFEAITGEPWEAKLPKFLRRFVGFYRITINPRGPNYKKHYHIYRIRAMLDNLDSTGSFNLNYAEPYKSMMLVYKADYKSLPSKQEEFASLLDYIEGYADKLEGK
jgi:hypothetical protein